MSKGYHNEPENIENPKGFSKVDELRQQDQSFHIDYYTIDYKGIHDVNKYDSLISAMKQAVKQLTEAAQNAPIRKIVIQPTKESKEIRQRKE